MKIIFATNNKHKLQEVNDIAQGCVEFLLPSANFNPIETGESFEANSYIKAAEAAQLSGIVSLADDSGLCVEALNGAPGIHSARYAETQNLRIKKLLNELAPHTNKNAKFVCCMTLVTPKGEVLHQVRGECTGKIISTPRGNGGFGYDPIFVPEGYEKTLAELGDDIKNQLSHRSNALRKMLDFITNL